MCEADEACHKYERFDFYEKIDCVQKIPKAFDLK